MEDRACGGKDHVSAQHQHMGEEAGSFDGGGSGRLPWGSSSSSSRSRFSIAPGRRRRFRRQRRGSRKGAHVIHPPSVSRKFGRLQRAAFRRRRICCAAKAPLIQAFWSRSFPRFGRFGIWQIQEPVALVRPVSSSATVYPRLIQANALKHQSSIGAIRVRNLKNSDIGHVGNDL